MGIRPLARGLRLEDMSRGKWNKAPEKAAPQRPGGSAFRGRKDESWVNVADNVGIPGAESSLIPIRENGR